MKETNALKKKMMRLVFPIAFQQFMLALVSACDAVMLGKLSQDSMSAVSLASQVTFVFNLWFFCFPALLRFCFFWERYFSPEISCIF